MRPHILFAGYTFGRRNGVETCSVETAHALQRLGAEIRVFSALESGERIFENVSVRGMLPHHPTLYRICWHMGWFWFDRMLRILSPQVDLVIAGHVHVLPSVMRYARPRGTPCWVVVHGIDVWPDWSDALADALERCERIIAVSEYTAATMRRRISDEQKVVVIPNCVDTELFSPRDREYPSLDQSPLVILTVGRFEAHERYKGHDLVIAALPSVSQALDRSVEYWIVGEGNDRQRLEQLAAGAGVAHQVKFKGRLDPDELIQRYRDCDVFAMPSYVSQRLNGSWTGEGFGIVYIEAAACGKPVIACDVGGQTDAIVHGVTGLLVKPTVRSVEAALVDLLSHPRKARKMGAAGRQWVLEHFTRQRFVEHWRALLAPETLAPIG